MGKKKSVPQKAPSAPSSPADVAVNKANKTDDLQRTDLAQFASFTCSDFTVQLRTYTISTLPKELHDWVFDLCKANMEAMYKKVWGWNNNKKRRQFTAPASRFCIAFLSSDNGEEQPVAYVNYRYEAEDSAAVMYCYELQLVEQVRRRGLGPRLMELLEVLAASAGMSRVMLTVMSENEAALRMYARLGYSLDDSSPGIDDPRDDSGYRIMSKKVQGQGQDVEGSDAAPSAASSAAAASAGMAKMAIASAATGGAVGVADVQQQRDTAC